MSMADPLGTVVLGRRLPAPVSGGRIAKGRITALSVDTSGNALVTFTDRDFDGGQRTFGPARAGTWRVTVTDASVTVTGPQVGDTCLVIFVGASVGDPWVIGWGRPTAGDGP